MSKLFDIYLKAKKISYGKLRLKRNIKGIAIHGTGNKGDTAENNVKFFSQKYGSNTREAGAHIFIDRQGRIGKSIPLNRSAYAVGNPKNAYAKGAYYAMLNNDNTVSIELCDIEDKLPSNAQIASLKRVIKYIKKYCPNVRYIVRHYDIVKKNCPTMYVKNPKKWVELKNELMKLI